MIESMSLPRYDKNQKKKKQFGAKVTYFIEKLLLKHGADLGIGAPHCGRSAIFEMIYNHGYKEWVLSSMIKYCKESELSKVDKLTGMTPLEVAIRRRNRTLLDLLLSQGANPNTSSCSKAKEPGFYDKAKVNAVFHALRHANLPILETLINRTQHPIDWKAMDAKGRTVFCFLADAVDGYSIRSLDYLHCIAKSLGQLQCKEVMEIADKDGFLPTELALKNGRRDMYDAFCKYGAKALDDSNEKLLLLPFDDAGAMDIDLSEQSQSQQPTATERRVMTTLNFARNAKGGTREANFLGNSFRAFPNCDITEISRDAMDFRMIESYIRAPLTAYEYSYMNHMNHDKFIALEHVFSIDRHEERPPLQLQETNTRRNLLWHRFDMAKADEIFRDGLQCTPEANYMDPSVPVIEFVDVLSALSPRNVIHPPRSMFLLCEVAIGCVLSAARGVVVTSTYKSVEIPGQVGPLRPHWLRDRTGVRNGTCHEPFQVLKDADSFLS
ncbi:hypothetical protein BC940DRAFT_14199 [Gongronella butleri]|nr:hypothetical protein BC940DRAFT_14199 [Gongronella butleri]